MSLSLSSFNSDYLSSVLKENTFLRIIITKLSIHFFALTLTLKKLNNQFIKYDSKFKHRSKNQVNNKNALLSTLRTT